MPNRSKDWFAQAEHDLAQAAASHRDGRHDWACFAAHQASEKAVKALHLAQGSEACGHVTTRLFEGLPASPPEELIERARVLDNYHIPPRYPHLHVEGPAFEHYGSLHSSQAVEHAGDILDFVRNALAGSCPGSGATSAHVVGSAP